MSSKDVPSINVIAGVNGGGKSSIQGAVIRESGGDYYNPDEAARKIVLANLGFTQRQANSAAWKKGVDLLKRAIAEKNDFTFESTLGANTIPALLHQAASRGFAIHIWYVGLSTPELHIARVRQRVSRGGHPISEEDIRRRYESSRLNLVKLIPRLTSLRVFDNSFEGDPEDRKAPQPILVLHLERGRIVGPSDLTRTPNWAKPIVAAAIKHSGF